MASADLLQVEGTIAKMNNGFNYVVRLDSGHAVQATLSGRLLRNRIVLTVGDRVRVGLSPYDLARGRIEYRY